MSTEINTDENEKSKLSFEDLKDRVSSWCEKLYSDGVYSYVQYQDCLKNVDTGSVSYYKKDEQSNVDDNKDTERIYGYYKKGKAKINSDTSNPNIPVIEDDFQKMTLYHYKKNKFLTANKDGIVSIDIDSDEKDWQLIALGKKEETNVYAIRSKYGKFLMGSDNGSVNASDNIISTWCQWKMIKHNDNFAFQSVIHKKYLAPVGDDVILADGWSDNNLWVMKRKEVPTGKHLIKFDNSSLVLKKNNLLNEMYNYYRKSIDNKYEREYYKNKYEKLDDLRNEQLNYLLGIIDNNINRLQTKKDEINDDKTKTTAENVVMLDTIESTLMELEMYKNDVQTMFRDLKEKEKQELNQLIIKSEKNRVNNVKLYKKSEENVEKFINELVSLNKKTETEINKLVGSLDIKLEINNQLGLNLEQNKSTKSYEDLTEIVNTNFNITKSSLTTERRFFFLGIIEIILILLLLFYFGKKTASKM
jgi:hypothetical protein